jgi:hypothetical protein
LGPTQLSENLNWLTPRLEQLAEKYYNNQKGNKTIFKQADLLSRIANIPSKI